MRAACARVLSFRAEFSRRLDDEVGSLIVHVGPCRCGRWWYVVLPAGAACAQALSYRAEFSRRLDDEVGGLVAHVGPCR
jgi:hypothetical protein